MTPEQFAYWLQGFAEIGDEVPTKEQWVEIKNHLATVFTKITPNTKKTVVSRKVFPDGTMDWMNRPSIMC